MRKPDFYIFHISIAIFIGCTARFLYDLVRNPKDRFSCDMADVSFCFSFEPRYEKTSLRGFIPGQTQTRLCSHRGRLEA